MNRGLNVEGKANEVKDQGSGKGGEKKCGKSVSRAMINGAR